MKQKFLLKTMLLLSALIAGSGSAWATLPDNPQWVATALSSISDGATVIIISNSTTNTNIALPSTTTTSNPAKKACNVSTSDGISTITPPEGTALQDLAWTLKKVTSDNSTTYQFFQEGSSSVRLYLTGLSSNTALRVGDANSENDKFVLGDLGKLLKVSTGTRFVGPYDNNGSDWRTYNTENATNYKSAALTFYVLQSSVSTPSISAENVSIGYNETSGSLAYTINNPVDGGAVTSAVVTSSTPSGWLTVNTPYTSPISLSCDANATAASKTATVHLTYTYNTDETVEKDVTVTQAGNPDVVDNIEDISALNTSYTVKGTVVATNSRGFVIGDGTGYVYYYKGTDAGKSVGDIVKISGTTGTYGHILQFTNSATITTESTSSYDGTPAVATIDAAAISAYNSDYQLSDYVQFEGTLSYSSSNYIISDNESTVRISYPTTAQTTALSALVDKTVRVKGYFAGFSSSTFTLMMESIEEVTYPTITTESSLAVPNYVVGTAEPEHETLTVSGSNLTDDITLSLGASSNFEMSTDLSSWTNTLTLTQSAGSVTDAVVAVRLKAGLSKGDYDGTLTLSSTGATNVNVSLSGSVTGQTYAIYIDDQVTGGTIEADLASAEEGATVTLTATPDAAYTFDSWTVLDGNADEVPVNNNQFTMPASAVEVSATFTAKPTYAVTCTASPVAGGEIISDLDNAYEGQTVTLSYTSETGYSLSSIAITKTSDGSATGITPAASGDDYTFTMPAYDVTVTATFNEVYSGEGTFIKYESAITEGYYVITYNSNALNNTISSNRFTNESFTATNDIITNPNGSIVWYIKPSGDYWTLYNEAVSKYAAGTGTKNQGALINDVTDLAKWTVTVEEGVFQFENLGRSNASSDSGNKWLRNNGNNGWACYASGTGGALTLYKLTTLTKRTITFNGNGGTYNEATSYTQEVNDGVATALTANKFTNSTPNTAFAGWSTTADGDVVYADGASVTLNADLTLYAKWNQSYTAMVDDQIANGTVEIVTPEGNVDIIEAAEGAEVTLTYTPATGYRFNAWNVYEDGDDTNTVTVTDNKFTMPAYDVIISATFEEIPSTTYTLATSITSGKRYIIVGQKTVAGENTYRAMGAQNTNNRSDVGGVTVDGQTATAASNTGIYEFNIYGPNADGYYTIYDAKSSGYLYAASSSSNHLKTQENNDNNGKWRIGINSETGVASVIAQGSNTRNVMQYNSSSSLFACYSSASQSSVYLYEKSEPTPTESVSVTSAGYATYVSTQNAIDFTGMDATVKAYIATANETTGVNFAQIHKVPANTGVLLVGTEGETVNATVPCLTGSAEATTNNVFVPGTDATVASEGTSVKNYILSNGSKGVGFYPASGKVVNVGKAYISVPTETNVKGYIVLPDFEDDPTSIENLNVNDNLNGEGAIYNLAGLRLNKMQKGINIVNGKKVMK